MQARVVGAFARGEAEKKSERQRLGAQRDAAPGTALDTTVGALVGGLPAR
jgi:DNA invertase Pin-like site-specific DNA recombinase